jgi:hypothetical protein
MTTIEQISNHSNTRQGALGDFATGQRTYADNPLVRGDFATGMRTIAKLAAVNDFATGMRTFPAPMSVGDFATGMRTVPGEVLFLGNHISSAAIAA